MTEKPFPRCAACLSYRPRSEVYGFCWEPKNGQYHPDGRVACYPVVKYQGSSCALFRDKLANREAWK